MRGWTERYARSQTDDIPSVTELARWLESHRPAESGAALIHNDYKLDNVVLDPDDLTHIIGVLDWEMATLGDPLMDLGTSLCYWVEAANAPQFQVIRWGPTSAPGSLTRRGAWWRATPSGAAATCRVCSSTTASDFSRPRWCFSRSTIGTPGASPGRALRGADRRCALARRSRSRGHRARPHLSPSHARRSSSTLFPRLPRSTSPPSASWPPGCRSTCASARRPGRFRVGPGCLPTGGVRGAQLGSAGSRSTRAILCSHRGHRSELLRAARPRHPRALRGRAAAGFSLRHEGVERDHQRSPPAHARAEPELPRRRALPARRARARVRHLSRDHVGALVFELMPFTCGAAPPHEFEARLGAFLSPAARRIFPTRSSSAIESSSPTATSTCSRAHRVGHVLNFWERMPDIGEQLDYPRRAVARRSWWRAC